MKLGRLESNFDQKHRCSLDGGQLEADEMVSRVLMAWMVEMVEALLEGLD